MLELHFWRRLLKVGISTLIVYLFVGYIVFGVTVVRWEVSLLHTAPVATKVAKEGQNYGILATHIRNVFGDPIPYAVVHIDNRLVQGDNQGFFEIKGLLPGRHQMEIFAGNYQPYKWEVQIEPGTNSPVIKYESGLWPQEFLADFHVFYHNESRVFGTIGFANGTDHPLYLHRAVIYDPYREEVIELLQENGGMNYYQNLSSKLDIISQPQNALMLPGKSWVTGELTPLEGSYVQGAYSLEVFYGTLEEHQAGNYRILRVRDFLDKDKNWDPHL